MKSSFLVKFFIGGTCLFFCLFCGAYLINWESFKTVSELINKVIPFLIVGIVCLWGFGIAADNEKKCIEIEESVVDKTKKLAHRASARKNNVIAQYNVLMNMSSRDNRDYYNVLRRAC